MSDRNLYSILGLSRTAETSEIRTAYKKLAMEHHPDKGGDPEKFKELSQAHEILSDPSKRRQYDITGSISDQPNQGFGMGMPMQMPEMFSQMFGGMFPGGNAGSMNSRKREGKGPGKTQEIPLCIADFYHGRNLSIKLGRQSFCKGCKGSGASSTKTCEMCRGSGQVHQTVMMGPIQMVSQTPCHNCSGSGQQTVGICNDCQGKKVLHEEKTLDFKVEPGMMSGNTVTFAGMCSAHPNYTEAGDVIVILREADEDEVTGLWLRESNKLKSSVTINLTEALLGTTKLLKGHPGYPNGLPIEIPPAVQNGWTGVMPSLGMPIRGTPRFGDAHIVVLVVPTIEETNVIQSQSLLLKSILPVVTPLEGTYSVNKGKWSA